MKHSTDRILITHVGSLPRSQAVTDVLFARERVDVRADCVDIKLRIAGVTSLIGELTDNSTIRRDAA